MPCFCRIIASLLVCVALSACQKPTTFTPNLSEAELRNEELAQQQIVNEIKAKGGKPKPWKNHPNMRKQFERVGERIEKAGAEICLGMHLQERGCYYYFRLNQDNSLNSHADGENVVIYTGMLRFVESDDELAVVMAHELAHNLMGHVQAQKNNATIGLVLGVAVDALASSQGINSGGSISKTGEDIGVLSYSAEFEQEADYVGLYIMARAGYDIKKAPSLWRRMSIEDPKAIYVTSTHPSNAARFVALQKAVYEIKYKREHKLPVLPDFKADLTLD